MRLIIRGKKLVTVGQHGTIENGAMVIEQGKIIDIGKWDEIQKKYAGDQVADCSNYVITPGLVDCHTHLLEFAPTTLYPVTPESHFLAASGIIFHALSSGITALGEQICGHPNSNFSIDDYRAAVKNVPIDISFAATSISIGFKEMVHFTSITGSQRVLRQDLADHILVQKIAENSDFPGENVFINATPANFSANEVPRAGEIIYSLDELKQIVQIYHNLGKKIGCHVAGEKGIEMALAAGFNCLHHAHGISKEQLKHAKTSGVHIVATPLGGTHLKPNSPEEIAQMLAHRIPVSIATDSYLPPYPNVPWLHFSDQTVKGPDTLMKISQPTMRLLKDSFDENDLLALITANPAKLLGKEDRFGRLEVGLEANFLVVEGIPGLEITDIEKIKHVYYQGKKIIDRTILS